MHRYFQRFTLFIGLFICLSAAIGEGSGTTGFEVLSWDLGARSAGMAGAFTAISGDLHGLAYNPASCYDTEDRFAALTYHRMMLDIQGGFFAFHKHLPGQKRITVGIRYVNYGQMDRTNEFMDPLGHFTPGEAVFSAAYSGRKKHLTWGITGKFIHSNLDSYTSQAIALDAGLLYYLEKYDLTLGFALNNIGQSVSAYIEKHEKLPSVIRLGLSHQLEHLPLLLNINIMKYLYSESGSLNGMYWSVGGEFDISDNFLLRWGYQSKGRENKIGIVNDRMAGLGIGLGFRFGAIHVDAAWNFHGALGTTSFFTCSLPI